jgi:DNA topoisomerase IB
MLGAGANTSITRPCNRSARKGSSTACWKRLPGWRTQLRRELGGRGLHRDRVLALALHLVDLGYFRAGNQQYAEEHESYGIASLLREHVTVRRQLEIEDPQVVGTVRSLLRCDSAGDRFLVCRNESGWADIRADDLNARFNDDRRRVQRKGSAPLARHGAGGDGVR